MRMRKNSRKKMAPLKTACLPLVEIQSEWNVLNNPIGW